jgi:ATP-binding cassette subfamily B protein
MFSSGKILGSKFRKALAQLPNLPRALKLVWEVARPWTTAWIVLLIVQGLLPAAIVYLTKLVVDGVVVSLRGPSSWPVIPLLLLGGVLLLMEIVRNAINWVRTVQAELLQDHITSLIHEKSVTVDLAFYELSDYYDHLHRARAEARYRPVALLGNLGALLQNSITLIAMGAILIPLGPWLALALLLSTLPAFFVVIHYALAEYEWRQRTTTDDRRAWYYDWIMTTAEAAAEIRLFGLGKYFQSSHRSLRGRLRHERLRLTRRQSLAELAASLIALVIMGAAIGLMVWRTLLGLVTLGELAMIYAAFNQGQGLMRTLLENAGQLYGNSLFLGNLFEFFALESSRSRGGPPWPPLGDIQHAINFNGVSFRYPDATKKALDDFTMTIPSGKIVAIVGPNGAGKSTLLKLLCRFYDVDKGSITIDGRDLKDFATDDLRRLITVLFQQPFHYNTTVRENILYGDLKLEATESEINAALRAAGAEDIVKRLPKQEQTLLGRWFPGGAELSVGEWQRIALARAFLRRAPIIILDEPTSALDPWAEADWLDRFRQLAYGRTSIIITHRFTTAMHADVIHVMDRGRIIESGSHQNLLAQNGLYAQSWSRQMTSAAYARSV